MQLPWTAGEGNPMTKAKPCAPHLFSFWQCRRGSIHKDTSRSHKNNKRSLKGIYEGNFYSKHFFSLAPTTKQMKAWNQTWHPTCRTWLCQMELCLNSTLLPVPIKQNTQKLKSNGRTKNVQFLEVDQKKVRAESMPEKTPALRSKGKSLSPKQEPKRLHISEVLKLDIMKRSTSISREVGSRCTCI